MRHAHAAEVADFWELNSLKYTLSTEMAQLAPAPRMAIGVGTEFPIYKLNYTYFKKIQTFLVTLSL